MTGWESVAFAVLGAVLFALAMRRAERARVWPVQVACVLVALLPFVLVLALIVASRVAVVAIR